MLLRTTSHALRKTLATAHKIIAGGLCHHEVQRLQRVFDTTFGHECGDGRGHSPPFGAREGRACRAARGVVVHLKPDAPRSGKCIDHGRIVGPLHLTVGAAVMRRATSGRDGGGDTRRKIEVDATGIAPTPGRLGASQPSHGNLEEVARILPFLFALDSTERSTDFVNGQEVGRARVDSGGRDAGSVHSVFEGVIHLGGAIHLGQTRPIQLRHTLGIVNTQPGTGSGVGGLLAEQPGQARHL